MTCTIFREEQAADATSPLKAGIRSPLGRLLHALNQPLTGLQCLMEVALASPRTLEQYAQGLREGLELTERMRALVEAIREVTDGEEENKNESKDDESKDNESKEDEAETTDLNIVLREVVEELEPVAAVKQVRIGFNCAAASLAVKARRRRMSTVVFQLVESALGLAEEGSALQIETGGVPGESLMGGTWIRMRWQAAQPQSEFCRPELGLLVAQAGWERVGARWQRERTENLETVTVRLRRDRDGVKPGAAMSVITAFPTMTGKSGGALIASPSSALRQQVLQSLNGRWRPVQHALGGAEALVKLEQGEWQVLFLDRRLPDLASEELIAIIQRRFPGIQVVLLDSDAADPADDAEKTEERAEPAQGPELAGKNISTTDESRYEPLPGMIGRSEAMQRIYRLAQLVARRSTTVLVVGPTGSGKELVARALHTLSPRAARPFVAVNCAAIPEALLESELFGHARGAFTGAVQAQVGRIPAAHGGTLFLDEVSELPFGMQAKLLRFLEQKEVQRLGTADVARVDVRVIAASNADLAGRAGRGEFREDLFYRLSAFPLELPSLAERRCDIVPLAEHFLACMAAAGMGPCPRLSGEAVGILEGHPWRGNVRELQHVMERASILVENGDSVLSEHLYFPFQHALFQPAARTLACAGRAS